MISCKEATYFIDKKQGGKLTFKQKLDLKVHLLICSICKAYDKQSSAFSKLLRLKASDEAKPLTEEEKNRLIKGLH